MPRKDRSGRLNAQVQLRLRLVVRAIRLAQSDRKNGISDSGMPLRRGANWAFWRSSGVALFVVPSWDKCF